LPVQAIQYAQSHLLMLSGLYGLLKPLDLMQPYRLEMGTKFGIAEARNLYQFWDNTITDGINARLAETGADTLLNLASNEYFKSVKVKSLQARVVTPVFKDLKNGQYKMISFYAKKARGLMARFVLLNQIDQVDDCKNFDLEGYHFVPEASDHQTLTFHRDHAE
jgi:cytoplasmic iron level regulating protein YaaA (DUF328/UPF0246 family)